jgi:hypothetical protein
VHDGIRLYFSPLATSNKPLHIRLHQTTAQDLTLDLGPPLRIHYKEDERMTIHSIENVEDDSEESDCRFSLCVAYGQAQVYKISTITFNMASTSLSLAARTW